MYLIGTVPIEGGYTCEHIQVYKRSKKDAIAEYYRQIKQAFEGETVLCYDSSERNGYKELMPMCEVKKTTDYRFGDDDMGTSIGDEHRKRFLKYKYLGKING